MQELRPESGSSQPRKRWYGSVSVALALPDGRQREFLGIPGPTSPSDKKLSQTRQFETVPRLSFGFPMCTTIYTNTQRKAKNKYFFKKHASTTGHWRTIMQYHCIHQLGRLKTPPHAKLLTH